MSWTSALAKVWAGLNTRLFEISGTPVTVATLISALLAILVALMVSRLVRRALTNALQRRGGRDGTIGAINGLTHYVILLVGISIALQFVGANLTALFAAGAVFAVGLGFAMKNIAENFVSGIILLVERTIRPGDVIQVEGSVVKVLRMGIRATVGQTRDAVDIILPNSTLVQSAVKNYTLGEAASRTRIPVGVVYSSDMNRVEAALMEAAREAAREVPEIVSDREPEIIMVGFGDNSVNFEVVLWINDPWRALRIRSRIAQSIWWSLKKQGLVIAFPQLDVHFDEPVASGLAALAGREVA